MSRQAQDFEARVRAMPDYDQHEEVALIRDDQTGLVCLIAVHHTARGPGVGGCRLWRYTDQAEALTDVLRLSKGMTYKNAISDLPFGGGKAVIMAPDFSVVDRTQLMTAFGRAIEHVGGAYYTAEDVGTTCDDMTVINRETDYIFGLAHTSGDPSPFTAYGVFLGIQEAIAHRLASDSLKGVHVVVQGLGNVGYSLCEQLHEAGARLTVSDIHADVVARCEQTFGATVVAPEAVYDVEADVYAPCALGATVSEAVLDRLKVTIIAGAANNQLAHDGLDTHVAQQGILYAPDYVINAGGIVNIACESGDYQPEVARAQVARIAPRLRDIFEQAQTTGRTTLDVANAMARTKFQASGAAGDPGGAGETSGGRVPVPSGHVGETSGGGGETVVRAFDLQPSAEV